VGSGQGEDDPERDPARGNIFDPVQAGLGDEVRVDFSGGSQPGDPTGSTSGQGVENLPLTGYSDRFGTYRDTALDSLDRLVIPSAMRDLVRLYFTELEP
jgi:hypothetical protein